ncbi:MAG TPA: GNAT family N-acetyltransferase [Anaeromyxobacteraceae bacterium]|nr:GNAT family N-acetyltransferase [Anaeromyxobacteraceae bacterium]
MLQIRRAIARDVPAILGLVKDLARYEREPDAVVATEADYLRDGFGPAPRFAVEIAEWDGEVVGFALWFHSWSTWRGRPGLHLEDLFVRPAARGRGIGKALLAYLARRALDEGCARFEWQVLDWNEPARRFYEGLGASALPEWVTMRVEGEALERLARGAG